MRTIHSILVVAPSGVGQTQLERLVGNAMSFGQWLRCQVHFLTAPGEAQALEDAVTEFKRANPSGPSTLVIHPTVTAQVDRILETIQKYSCNLVVLQDGTVLYEEAGTGTRGILEISPSPILLLPKEFNFRSTPPDSFLVPMSGEQRLSEALTLSLKLAHQTKSPVDFLHVTIPDKPCTCEQSFEALGDQLHHEYREMTEKIASEASPYSTPTERSRIRRFHHCRGFTTEEILGVLEESPGAILVLEWRGTLAEGHAQTIKDILRDMLAPALFVRTAREQRSKLRVGKNIKAA